MHSAPPASATSTVERRIARYASPSACADEVHAVWMVAVWPSIPTRPASRAARNSSTSAGAASAAAIRVGNPSASKWLIRRTPDAPASAAFQNESTSKPIGVTTPSPVTTTRRRPPASGAERVATIDRQHLPLDEPRRRAREEEHDVGDRLGSHERLSRCPRADRLERLGAVGDQVPDVGLDGAGRNRVHRDLLRAELDGKIAGERLERG